jgi:hypothetical protein
VVTPEERQRARLESRAMGLRDEVSNLGDRQRQYRASAAEWRTQAARLLQVAGFSANACPADLPRGLAETLEDCELRAREWEAFAAALEPRLAVNEQQLAETWAQLEALRLQQAWAYHTGRYEELVGRPYVPPEPGPPSYAALNRLLDDLDAALKRR